MKRTHMLSLAVEEMAGNVIAHGFRKDAKQHHLEVRVVCKGEELIVRMRDDCKPFDPKKRYEKIHENDDPAAMLGLRMALSWAKEVGYTTVLNLNNVTIRV